MNKQDYIQYWQKTAEKDWIAIGHLYEKGDYLHSLFFAHLVIEKLIKAHWVKDNQTDFPPRIHNLTYLLTQTQLSLFDYEKELLVNLNAFQIEGRYPDYQYNIAQLCTQPYTKELLEKAELLKDSLLNGLP